MSTFALISALGLRAVAFARLADEAPPFPKNFQPYPVVAGRTAAWL
jgi:hypothetical protein